jgi:hypothetical protein
MHVHSSLLRALPISTRNDGSSRVPMILMGRTVPAPSRSKSGLIGFSKSDLIPLVVWETLAWRRSVP